MFGALHSRCPAITLTCKLCMKTRAAVRLPMASSTELHHPQNDCYAGMQVLLVTGGRDITVKEMIEVANEQGIARPRWVSTTTRRSNCRTALLNSQSGFFGSTALSKFAHLAFPGVQARVDAYKAVQDDKKAAAEAVPPAIQVNGNASQGAANGGAAGQDGAK